MGIKKIWDDPAAAMEPHEYRVGWTYSNMHWSTIIFYTTWLWSSLSGAWFKEVSITGLSTLLLLTSYRLFCYETGMPIHEAQKKQKTVDSDQ